MIKKKYGKWKVIELVGRAKNGSKLLLCECICGVKKTIRLDSLNLGKSNACKPCSSSGRPIKHGKSLTSEYNTWRNIKKRCELATNKDFKNYGERGIKVCERWKNSFSNFISDMGKRPFEKAQIDRINNNGDYSPDNCRWVTHSQNLANRRCTKIKTS